MIAVIEMTYPCGVQLIPNTEENMRLLKAAAKEVGLPVSSEFISNTYKVEAMLKDIPLVPRGEITECEAVFIHMGEW